MCQSLMELDHVAQEHGWFGYSEGPGPEHFLIYTCGCPDGHTTFISNTADDPEYYEHRCAFIRTCRTP
jgi:hypothetical protein